MLDCLPLGNNTLIIITFSNAHQFCMRVMLGLILPQLIASANGVDLTRGLTFCLAILFKVALLILGLELLYGSPSCNIIT